LGVTDGGGGGGLTLSCMGNTAKTSFGNNDLSNIWYFLLQVLKQICN
jgi:hypothetical protein